MIQRRKAYQVLFIVTLLLFTFTVSYADWGTFRDYEPVVMKGSEFTAYLGQPVTQIFAFSYDASLDQWRQIPLQIDEKDDSTHVWVPAELKNGVLDSNDEVVFMARDMGDQVPNPYYWIDNPESREYERYEIVASDPLDETQRYLYFFMSTTLVDTTTGYMDYTPPSGGYGTDIVFGASYTEGHNQKGIADSWEIPVAAGGTGVDILDRQKARGAGIAFGFVPLDLTEDDFTYVKIEFVAGKVRVSRRLWLSIFGLYTFDLPMYYYPYSVDNKGASGTLDPSQINVSHIRQSFDLSPEAGGMMFFSNQNDSIIVDGIADADINHSLVFSPDVNWFLFTGEQGTVLTLLQMTQLGTTQLYYWDNSAGGSGDGKDDTGDGQSWGDTGILITGSGLEGRLSFSFLDYFLPANQQKTIGSEFVNNFHNPLSIHKSSQLVPVELATFEASVQENGVLLTWATASESDNYGFAVQRKAFGQAEWESIGFVQGKNTTSEPQFYQFFDKTATGADYFYRLKQIDLDGAFHLSQEIEVHFAVPKTFAITNVFPNPFNSRTRFHFTLPRAARVDVSVVDVLGRFVRSIFSGDLQSGKRYFDWDGKDENGNIVSSGTYIVRINYQPEAENHQWRATKVIFVK
ncbi:MAG: T9SS type A sorting domain-containing protein [Calditrichaeota bacterium]|nr:T9SS type A sorting domain-containing protein [Calditrichota bacterium]